MPAAFDLVADRFQQALRTLVAASPVSIERTLKAEAGSILKACAGRTKVAKAAKITANERLRLIKDLGYAHIRGDVAEEGHISVNAGIRGEWGKIWQNVTRTRGPGAGTWGWQQTHGPGLRPLDRHFGERRWQQLQAAAAAVRDEERRRVPIAKQSAGLARQSWVQIADALGIRLEAVPGGHLSSAGLAKARTAIASDGRSYVNGLGQEERQQHGVLLRLINRLPFGEAAGLDLTLQYVLAGRAAYFEQNMGRGVFRDVDRLLKAYPGLTVHHN